MSISFEQSRAKLETKIDGQLKALKKKASGDATQAGYLERALAADALVDKFVEDIEKMEKDIAVRVEEDETTKGLPEYMKDVEGSDNMEGHIRYFLKDNAEGKEQPGFRGKALHESINKTRKDLVALLATDTTKQIQIDPKEGLAIEASSALRAFEGKENKKDWGQTNLEHAPLGAVIALLAQIKNDARATQSAVTDILAKGTESSYVIESLEAVVKTKSSAVLAGQEYKAEIFLAAKTKNSGSVEFKLLKGGSSDLLKIDGDKATYSVTPNSQGTVEWGGVILMKDTKGKTDSITFNSEYQVFRGQASIAATKMNVLYIGVDNPISIAVPGVEPGQVSARISGGGGSLSKQGSGKYVAKLTRTGRATISVTATIDGKAKGMGNQEYRVRKLPTPIAKFGTVGSGLPTPKQVLLAQSNIRASMGQGFAFEGLRYRVTGYQFIYAPKRGEAKLVSASNSQITGAMKGILRQSRRGDRIIIDKIRATGPGGKRTLLPLMIEIR